MEVRRLDEAGQLRQLLAYSRILHAVTEVNDIVRAALDEAPTVIPVESMSVALRDDTSGSLEVAGLREGDRVRTRGTARLNSPFAPIEAQVASFGTPVFVDDTLAASGTRRVDEALLRSLMIIPLRYLPPTGTSSERRRADLFGVMAVGMARPNIYTDTDKSLFREFANLTGTALGVSVELARQRRVIVEDAMVNAIMAKLQGRDDLASILASFTEELGQTFGAKRARAVLTAQPTPDLPPNTTSSKPK
jgi:GAF domain-containing protein